MISETILHYNILEKLGERGMGMVYLAEDTTLKRNVAIKFLPKHIAANTEERQLKIWNKKKLTYVNSNYYHM